MKKGFLKIGAVIAALGVMTAAFAGCSTTEGNDSSNGGDAAGTTTGKINVCSREDGSGTRGAFIELLGIEEKDESGEKVDRTVATAEITNSTAVMMTTVAGNKQAIGYISLGALSDDVKALKVDGAAPTVDAVKDGSYKVSRPFNIVTKEGSSNPAAEDFITFIMSEEGQKVVEEEGCISNGNNGAFTSKNPTGTITVVGSTSVSPVMEKLIEAYNAINGGLTIELQTNDSSTGVSSAIDGTCDIGMASRELKDEEVSKGAKATVIATDGIAVIVNNENSFDDLTSEQIKQIYIGEITTWDELAK